MNSKTILIIDDEPKNLELLVSGMVNNQLQVITSTSGYLGLEKAQKLHPDLILMDTEIPDLSGIEFTQKLKEDPQLSKIPVILLSTRDGIQDRLKAYEAGVKDYIIKPLHVNEIVARVEMILARTERRILDQEEKTAKITGKLEEKPPPELIEEFSMNQITGILNLTSVTGKSGQIFFREGQVVNAIVGNFRGERAIYQMIPWKQGKYSLVFQDIDIKDEISVSNLGLLLQAKKRLEKRVELVSSLPGLDTVFTLSNTFLKIIEKRKMSNDVMRFIQLFNGQRSIQKVIDDSFYDDIITLERILKMYQQDFLTEVVHKVDAKPKQIDVKEKREPVFSNEEFRIFQERVLRQAKEGKNILLVMGGATSGKKEMIQLLAGASYQTKTVQNQFPHPIDLGKILISPDTELTVIGVPVEKNLHLFVESFQNKMLGYIILVNAAEPETFDYLSYLIKVSRNRYQLPYTIAVSQLRHPKATGIESLTRYLGLESYEELLSCKVSELDNIKMLLLNMRASPSTVSRDKIQFKITQASN